MNHSLSPLLLSSLLTFPLWSAQQGAGQPLTPGAAESIPSEQATILPATSAQPPQQPITPSPSGRRLIGNRVQHITQQQALAQAQRNKTSSTNKPASSQRATPQIAAPPVRSGIVVQPPQPVHGTLAPATPTQQLPVEAIHITNATPLRANIRFQSPDDVVKIETIPERSSLKIVRKPGSSMLYAFGNGSDIVVTPDMISNNALIISMPTPPAPLQSAAKQAPEHTHTQPVPQPPQPVTRGTK